MINHTIMALDFIALAFCDIVLCVYMSIWITNGLVYLLLRARMPRVTLSLLVDCCHVYVNFVLGVWLTLSLLQWQMRDGWLSPTAPT